MNLRLRLTLKVLAAGSAFWIPLGCIPQAPAPQPAFYMNPADMQAAGEAQACKSYFSDTLLYCGRGPKAANLGLEIVSERNKAYARRCQKDGQPLPAELAECAARVKQDLATQDPDAEQRRVQSKAAATTLLADADFQATRRRFSELQQRVDHSCDNAARQKTASWEHLCETHQDELSAKRQEIVKLAKSKNVDERDLEHLGVIPIAPNLLR